MGIKQVIDGKEEKWGGRKSERKESWREATVQQTSLFCDRP